MSLFETSAAQDFRPDRRWPPLENDSLDIDEVMSRSRDDFGIDIDADDFLVLIEGADDF
ncbi:hypothetical protein [Pelagibius sp. 7325]|uniref:hypothetical protein n=1 Tax=Pelagibius sp. 7325 TaxID=3131994 RepID=UPI0030EF1FC8